MNPNINVAYILKWVVPEGLAVAASAIYLGAMRLRVAKGTDIDPFRARLLSVVGFSSCALSGTYAVLIGGTWNGLILAEPFDISAAILFGIIVFQPSLIAKSRLRIYLATCVVLSALVAMVSMREAWWLAR